MSNEVAKNVPNFIPMGQAAGERVKQDAPVELDGEGKPINPHIPQFISKAPWYLDTGAKSSLKHQRLNDGDSTSQTGLKNDWYKRDVRAGPAATKYRKGACENCGAATHKTKDCLDRPRKVGAKWTGRDIQADEVIQDIKTSWDSKRDRANGYDFTHHAQTLQAKYDRLEAIRAEKQDSVDSSDAPDSVDEVNPVSVADQTKSNSNTHMRIREDTANYLRKDMDDASYDPKTRTTTRAVPSAGDTPDKADFVRSAGDAAQFDKLQAFAWQDPSTSAKSGNPSTTAKSGNPSTGPALAGSDKTGGGGNGVGGVGGVGGGGGVKTGNAGVTSISMHAQAMPSQTALLYKAAQESKVAAKRDILARYGDETKSLPRHLLDAQDQSTLPDDSKQQLTKSTTNGISRYDEDVYLHGHTSVWGSWYDKASAQWGYSCCHSLNRDADCSQPQP